MFGGIGGLLEYRAGLLAAHGFAVLALAYFAYDDLPNQLQEVDLDYFEEAANLLLAHPKVPKILSRLPGNITEKKSRIPVLAIAAVSLHLEIVISPCRTVGLMRISLALTGTQKTINGGRIRMPFIF